MYQVWTNGRGRFRRKKVIREKIINIRMQLEDKERGNLVGNFRKMNLMCCLILWIIQLALVKKSLKKTILIQSFIWKPLNSNKNTTHWSQEILFLFLLRFFSMFKSILNNFVKVECYIKWTLKVHIILVKSYDLEISIGNGLVLRVHARNRSFSLFFCLFLEEKKFSTRQPYDNW